MRPVIVCCSVAQLCLTLGDTMDCSTPGLPVPHHLLEFAQVHVHCIDDAWLVANKKKEGGGRKKEKDTEDLVIKMGRDLSSASRCQSSELQGCGFRNSGNSVGICWSWVGRNVGTNMIFLRKCFSQPEAMTTEEAVATDTRAQDKTFLLMKDCGDGWLC